MNTFLEALFTLLPVDAGGREKAVWPREGTYRPLARLSAGAQTFRIRLIEGPPLIAPGAEGRVVVLVESDRFEDAPVAAGCELDVMEGERLVGLIVVARVWREATPVELDR